MVLLALPLAGCAKTGSSPAIALSEPSSSAQPIQLIVVVTNDLPSPVAGTIPRVVDAVLARELSDRLGSPGVLVSVEQAMPPDRVPVAGALLIHCSVTRLRVGNQALRMTVGFGAGRFNIVTRTSVVDLRRASVADLVSFQSHSTTGSMPGSGLGLAFAAGSGQVIGMVGGGAGLLLDARQTASERARQVADSVSGQLRAYFQTKGWTGLSNPPPANSALSGGAALAPPRPFSTS
ncbi:DUF4410 domain-containing protein [Acidisoma cellulosilytica]|uniref:DUF4410 domain-containing protein n=1 Tax=Acidisoma cellulosilyticum TaxID=2802395 RepID=A0A964E667_9PROT|nr:DUF4410 domain-containing protein [Acidisoma cellulosilyticum]